jgi:uncharacterized protein with HEPN domain
MRGIERDAAHLWDMLDAAKRVRTFVAGVAWGAFQADELRLAAVERTLEIVGEAARRVSSAFQGAHPEIPWREIIGQRNVLAHEYGEVDPALVWKTASEDIPRLIEILEKLVPPVPDTD